MIDAHIKFLKVKLKTVKFFTIIVSLMANLPLMVKSSNGSKLLHPQGVAKLLLKFEGNFTFKAMVISIYICLRLLNKQFKF